MDFSIANIGEKIENVLRSIETQTEFLFQKQCSSNSQSKHMKTIFHLFRQNCFVFTSTPSGIMGACAAEWKAMFCKSAPWRRNVLIKTNAMGLSLAFN